MSAQQIAGAPARNEMWESVRVAQVLKHFDDYPYLVAAVVENVTGVHTGLDRAAVAQAVRDEYRSVEIPKILAQITFNEKGDGRDLALDDEAAREVFERE